MPTVLCPLIEIPNVVVVLPITQTSFNDCVSLLPPLIDNHTVPVSLYMPVLGVSVSTNNLPTKLAAGHVAKLLAYRAGLAF